MKTLNDGTKIVYKRIPSEVFEMVEFMKKKNIPSLSRKISTCLTGYDYFVINRCTINRDSFDVQKYNGLGNLFEFSVYTFGDSHKICYQLTSYHHPTRYTVKPECWHRYGSLPSFENEMDFFKSMIEISGNLKFQMKMKKHNLDLQSIPF
jgi:hypothetical protein